MTTLRQAAEMALEAMKDFDYDKRMVAIDAVEKALAEPQRQWVWLTDDETMLLANETSGQHWMEEAHIQRFRAAIESKLREKNT